MIKQLDPAQRRNLAIVFGLALLYGALLSSQFYVPRLVNVLGGSATLAGMLLAISLAPVFVLAWFGKRIAQRFTPRQVLRMGLAAHAIQMIMLIIAQDIAMLVPAMIFGGFGYGLTFARLLNSASELTPKSHATQGIAYFTLMVQLGTGLGSIVIALTEKMLDTHGIFTLPLALSIASLALAGRLPMATPAQIPNAGDIVSHAEAPVAKARGNMVETLILMTVLGLIFGLPLQFVPMWLHSTPALDFSPAYFLTTSFFAIMVTRLLFGHWLVGKRELPMVLLCFAVVALAIGLLGLAHTPLQFVVCAIFFGFGYSLLYPSCIVYLLQQVGPQERAAWSVWILLGYEIGTRCMPALFGIIADGWGFPTMFVTLAIVVAVVGGWHMATRFGLLQRERVADQKTCEA